nr:hypothetical protein [Verrucomicrobium spinosum]
MAHCGHAHGELSAVRLQQKRVCRSLEAGEDAAPGPAPERCLGGPLQGGHQDEPAGPQAGESAARTASLRRPTISNLAGGGWVAVETIIDESVVREMIPALKALGAEGIIEYPLNKVVH